MKKLNIIFLSILVGITSCSYSNEDDTKNSIQSSIGDDGTQTKEQKVENTLTINATDESLEKQLADAKAKGKSVFVVVSNVGISETTNAIAIANEAAKMVPNAIVLKMNRDDSENVKYTTEWRLSGAPLPLILVISPKGLLVGGRILAQAKAKDLAAMIPSPKLEKVQAAISSGKNAIVVFTKKSFSDKNEVTKTAKDAVAILKTEGEYIEVDMDDPKETNFMNQLRVNPATAVNSITIVINKQGQVAGTSTTIPDAAKLVSAAKTPVKSGCGPGCGPSGCGK